MSDLKATLEKLAADFAQAAVAAIQGASLDDIAGIASSNPRAASAPHGRRAARPTRRGRLHRRSAVDIGKVMDAIVALLGKHKGGLRAEEIRAKLGVSKKELPRPIAEGLSAGKLKKRGEKRATTYFVGAGAATKPTPRKAKAPTKAKQSRKAAPARKRTTPKRKVRRVAKPVAPAKTSAAAKPATPAS